MRAPRRTVVAAVATALALGATAGPVGAASWDAVVLSLSVWYTPPLGPAPGPQSLWVTGGMTTVGTDGVLVTYPCTLSGTTTEGAAAGAGMLSGSCGHFVFRTCVYSRAGASVSLACTDDSIGQMTATLVWSPNDVLAASWATMVGPGEWVSPGLGPVGGVSTYVGAIVVGGGDGYFSPGLGAVPEQQSLMYSVADVPAVRDGQTGLASCYWVGIGLADSIAEGVGTFGGGCWDFVSASLDLCVYVRVGVVMTVICPQPVSVTRGDFIFTPVELLPTNTYTLVGVMETVRVI